MGLTSESKYIIYTLVNTYRGVEQLGSSSGS